MGQRVISVLAGLAVFVLVLLSAAGDANQIGVGSAKAAAQSGATNVTVDDCCKESKP